MEEKYIFLILGVILGAAIMLYFFCNREEKIERTIIRNQKVFSTKIFLRLPCPSARYLRGFLKIRRNTPPLQASKTRRKGETSCFLL